MAKGRGKEADAIRRWALQSQNLPRINAMITLAASLPELRISVDQLDRHPHLLTVRNGTIDLRTGELREHRREDYITLLLDTEYHADARAPRWERFIAEVTGGDQEMADFLQAFCGYSLTGEVYDRRAFFLVVGPPGSGKTTFAETLRELLGEYGATADVSTFLERKGDRIPNDLARLRAKRLVVAGELPEEGRMAAHVIKALTGKDTIIARFLHREYFEYRPTFKVLLSSNHVPSISAGDEAVWERVVIIPFNHSVEREKRELNLLEQLLAEREGILAWAVQGAVRFHREGLRLPRAVVAKTQEVRQEMDLVGQFLETECDRGSQLEVASGELYGQFSAWCRNHEGIEHPMSHRRFTTELQRHGVRCGRTSAQRKYIGVAPKQKRA